MGLVQALTEMIAPSREVEEMLQRLKDAGSGEGAPVDTQREKGGPTDEDVAAVKEPIEWVLLEQMLEIYYWRRSKRLYTRCKKDPRNLTDKEKIEKKKLKRKAILK